MTKIFIDLILVTNKLAKVNGFTIRESIVKINHPNHSLRI